MSLSQPFVEDLEPLSLEELKALFPLAAAHGIVLIPWTITKASFGVDDNGVVWVYFPDDTLGIWYWEPALSKWAAVSEAMVGGLQ